MDFIISIRTNKWNNMNISKFTLLTIVLLTILVGCVAKPVVRVAPIMKSYNETIRPRENSVILTFEDIDVEGSSGGAYAASFLLLGPLGPALVGGASLASKTTLEQSIAAQMSSEFEKIGVKTGENGDFFFKPKICGL